MARLRMRRTGFALRRAGSSPSRRTRIASRRRAAGAMRSGRAGSAGTPSLGFLCLLLALHAAKHVWEKLIWICDLARISQLPTLDWNWICSKARRLGIERIVGITLELAQKLLVCSIPLSIERRLSEDRAVGALAEEIEGYLAHGKTYKVESLAYFRRMLELQQRRIDRAGVFTRFVCTPGPGEWAMAQLPKPLFPEYRALRISRPAARLLVGWI